MLKYCLSAFVFLSTSLTAYGLEVADYPTYFNGPQQMQVTMLPLADEPGVLIQIKGVNHPIDQVVFRAEMQDRGQGIEAYRIQYDGVMRALLLKGNRWGNDYYQAFLPESGRDDIYLEAAENTEQFPDATALVDRYESQKADGVQANLARFNREKNEGIAEALIEEYDTEANSSCGQNVVTSIDWQQVDDDQLQSLNVGAYCGQVADEMARICDRMPEFSSDFSDVTSIQCHFGDELKLRKEDGTIRFYTTRDAPNQAEFINSFLRNF